MMRRPYTSNMVLVVAAFVAAMLMCACSPKKNTAMSRRYQEFITRYNIHYNGDKHYKETLAEMEENYEDDYTRLLFMHPVESKADPALPQPSGNFDRSIEKAQKAIQLRSIKKKPAKKAGKSRDPKYKEWMKRDEYNPFLHNSWMMMGRSQFYNGDFLGAASTFYYIAGHFKWLPRTVLEAKMMQALCYISLGWLFEAEMILTRIKTDELTTAPLRRLYNYAYADYYIHASDYEAALPFLREAAKSAKGSQKTRLTYLLAQVYERAGDKQNAYDTYAKAGSFSSAPYRTKFNARIKQSEVFSGSDIESEVKALKRMTRYDRNSQYLDQIYFAIGNLYLSRGDTVKAIENYVMANKESKRNGMDKAINQLKLGGLYYDQRKYSPAQVSYSEAVPILPKTYPGYDSIKRRSDVLDELAVYADNVHMQDSLLELAAMPVEQRDSVINKIIEDLKKREKEEAEQARREEFFAQQQGQGDQLQDNNSMNFNINADNSWYFYNTATKNAGKTEFQKRWGSRKLEDDWRRRNKATFNTGDFDQNSEEGDAEETEGGESTEEGNAEQDSTAIRTSDPHFPEYYLAQIPSTDAEKTTANEVIQEGLYNMGLILKDKLEDYPGALVQFDRLLVGYPDNIYRLDTYYNLYLMFMRQGKTAEAEQYRQLILSDFAESKYGMAMRDPAYLEKLKGMDAAQQKLYEETYAAYLDNRNDEVHKAYKTMSDEYPLSKIMPKFMFLDALAYVTEGKPEEFNSTLRDLLDRYPDTDITPIASAWLKGMAQGRELHAGLTNMRGLLWDQILSNDSTATSSEGEAQFTLDPDTRQILIFTYPTDAVSAPQLLFEIARHNFRSFVVKDFDLETMSFGRLGMILVRGFENIGELNHYRSVMAASQDFKLPRGVRPIVISESDFKILMDERRSFDDYFRYREEQNYVDAQAGILETEDIEPLPEEEVKEETTEAEEMPGQQPEQPVPVDPEAVPETLPDEELPFESEAIPGTTPDSIPATTDEPVTTAPAKPAAPNKPATPNKPAAPTKPVSPAKPTDLPEVPAGSEGDDDPLLNDE